MFDHTHEQFIPNTSSRDWTPLRGPATPSVDKPTIRGTQSDTDRLGPELILELIDEADHFHHWSGRVTLQKNAGKLWRISFAGRSSEFSRFNR